MNVIEQGFIPEVEKRNIVLETPLLEDVDFLVEMNEDAKIGSTGKGSSPERKEQIYKKFIEDISSNFAESDSRSYLVKNERENVGNVVITHAPSDINHATLLTEFPDINDENNRWHIKSTAISPDHRKKGFWTKAQTAVEDLARANDVNYITADVGKNNIAMRGAMESLGYTFYDDPDDEKYGYPKGTKLIGIKNLSN